MIIARLIFNFSLFLVLLQAAFLFFPLQAQDNRSEDQILKAYELRINGNHEEAQSVLKSILEAEVNDRQLGSIPAR